MDMLFVFGFYDALIFGMVSHCKGKQVEYNNTHKRVCEKIIDIKSCTSSFDSSRCIVKVESGKFVTIAPPRGSTEACWDEKIGGK